jgi:hypothetical protein
MNIDLSEVFLQQLCIHPIFSPDLKTKIFLVKQKIF